MKNFENTTFIADKVIALDTVVWNLIYVLFEHHPEALPTLIKGLDHSLLGDKLPTPGARAQLQAIRDAVARQSPIAPDLH